MTRKEAVEDLKTLKDFFMEQSGGSYPMSLEYAINELEKNLITEWIPVSERLPEKAGRYLTTCNKWGAWEVDWNIWTDSPKASWLWEQEVTAWMPLLKPYEEGGSE